MSSALPAARQPTQCTSPSILCLNKVPQSLTKTKPDISSRPERAQGWAEAWNRFLKAKPPKFTSSEDSYQLTVDSSLAPFEILSSRQLSLLPAWGCLSSLCSLQQHFPSASAELSLLFSQPLCNRNFLQGWPFPPALPLARTAGRAPEKNNTSRHGGRGRKSV